MTGGRSADTPDGGSLRLGGLGRWYRHGMAQLSHRGRALIEEAPMSPYFDAHYERKGDRFDARTNPDGYIGLCVAENRTVWPLLAPRLTAPRTTMQHSSICYDEMVGCSRFRGQLADFMAEHIHGRRFEPEQIAALAGTGSVLEILFYCIADAGDAVLVPTPSYAGFWADLETRNELTIVPVHTRSADGFVLTEDLLDEAWESSDRPIRGLVYTNPDNPRGAVASRDQIELVIRWCERRGIHLVLDEVYALSIHGDAEFVSGASLRPSLGPDMHLCWAFSKDFGASGLRCGVLVSENEEVMQSVAALAYWSAVSGETQHILGELISDREWVSEYLQAMQAGLRDSYTAVTDALDAAGIPYVPAAGGYFFLVDLRAHLDDATWEAEDALWRRILEQANVNLTPGSACRNEEPGFMRLCFAAEPKEAVLVAVERIARVLSRPA
jgi:aspartate/methionine/tyrosine aminotransferase